MWDTAVDACRYLDGGVTSTAMCIDRILDGFLVTNATEALECIRRHPILARDGFRCSVPICSRRTNLDSHYLQPRSQGSPDTA